MPNPQNYSNLEVTRAGMLTPAYSRELIRALRSVRLLSFGAQGALVSATNTGEGEQIHLVVSPGGSAASLYATLAGTDISVTYGTVNGGAEAITMGGDALDADPAPTLTIGTLPYFLTLRAEWVPGTTGTSPQITPDGVASIASYTIVGTSTTFPSATAPTVNASTGAVTQNGIAHFQIAKWEDDGDGNPVLSGRNPGNRGFKVCGVDEVSFYWNGV